MSSDINIMKLFKLFPDDATAEKWFVKARWGDTIICPHCEHDQIKTNSKHPTMPYRCKKCHKFFSVRINTAMQGSRIGYQKWAIAIYLLTNNPKGISSAELHRELGITYKTAWYLSHRIREGWNVGRQTQLKKASGPTEVDEAYVGGREHNKHAKKKLHNNWPDGKIPVLGAKDRDTNKIYTRVVQNADTKTLHKFVRQRIKTNSLVYTDGSNLYNNMKFARRSKVYHSIGQYVSGNAHTNGIESFWSGVKRLV